MPTVIEGNIEALSKNGNNIFPITTPRAVIEEGTERNLLDMLQDAARIPTATEVGARPDTWMPTAADVGAVDSNYVTAFVSQARADDAWILQQYLCDKWDAGRWYPINGYSIHNNALWKCKVANTGVEPTEGAYWTRCSITSELYNTIGNVALKRITLGPRTINANSTMEINLTDYLPANCYIITASVLIGDCMLPYVHEGQILTWVKNIWPGNKTVIIQNGQTVWTDYSITLTVSYSTTGT